MHSMDAYDLMQATSSAAAGMAPPPVKLPTGQASQADRSGKGPTLHMNSD